ncbi:DUF1206 domain-containing protein [Actinoplanes friuliensis]|uniref:DUF1206 domain-containing protein n=1 Tax=Actinoplanes friuliensis DSM 7358 TaxID=1246995 RepID=U5WF68_9ACTN|nr:DUF1206 domain-containing protein [Actinoplanes friuliensis]AGZ46680.1 hypothetical protein AFR_42130 [Actinoplanes friuliensis DSM 7358]
MPSLSSQARGAASRTAGSTWLEQLTRGGLVGYGIIHLLFAWLILQIAFDGSGADGDQSGALHELAERPFGTFLIAVIVIGMFALVIWQVLEAAIGHRSERGRHRVYERIVSAFRAAFYAYFAWTGIKVLRGKKASSADTQQKASEDLMASTGGRITVALAGIVIAAIGIGLVIYGIKQKFEKHLKVSQMNARMRRLSLRLGVAGYTAKGLAYGIAGVLFLTAAIQYDADKARGLDATLKVLAEQSYGPWLLALAALGIAAYGLFSIVQARYRKV